MKDYYSGVVRYLLAHDREEEVQLLNSYFSGASPSSLMCRYGLTENDFVYWLEDIMSLVLSMKHLEEV